MLENGKMLASENFLNLVGRCPDYLKCHSDICQKFSVENHICAGGEKGKGSCEVKQRISSFIIFF